MDLQSAYDRLTASTDDLDRATGRNTETTKDTDRSFTSFFRTLFSGGLDLKRFNRELKDTDKSLKKTSGSGKGTNSVLKTLGEGFRNFASVVTGLGLPSLLAYFSGTLISAVYALGGALVVAVQGLAQLGPLAASEVPAVLARSAVFALPCRVAPDGDRDGLPVAVLEAMAAALPVVTTDVAGLPEAVDQDTGWVVPAGDPSAFAHALRDALAAPEERASRGRRGRIRLEERGWTVAAQVDSLCTLWSGAPGHGRNVATSPQPERV